MKTQKILSIFSVSFICFSAFTTVMVSLLAFFDPQRVMNLLQVKLPNTGACSSIIDTYGSVGFTIFITFVYLAFNDASQSLVFAAVLWGFNALSRFITIAKVQWLAFASNGLPTRGLIHKTK